MIVALTKKPIKISRDNVLRFLYFIKLLLELNVLV